MTSLNLGDKFDTSNVTDMSYMFHECGYRVMTSLDLGDKFFTTKVTDVTSMFEGCGKESMTVLDLGPAFTKIPETNTDFITDCGTNSLVIYTTEAIYENKTSFKLN